MDLAYFTLSNLFYRQGLFDRIIKTVGKGFAESSRSPFFALTEARAEAKRGNTARAEKIYTSIMEEEPEVVSSYIDMGDLAANRNDFKEAIIFYKKAISIAPELSNIYLGLGGFYNKINDFDSAISYYKKAISLSPESVIGYNQLAWTLAERKGDVKAGLTYALKGGQLNPKNIEMKDTLAWIYYQMGNYDEALDAYKSISPIKTNNPNIYYHLGLVSQKLNRKDEAIRWFENALNLTDEFAKADDIKEHLESLGEESTRIP
jgi:tetratricopeptide (TPR) repeat protein